MFCHTSALLTDLYQLTMIQGYVREQMTDLATFEFFVYKLPPNRNFLIAAGLEQLLQYLETFTITDEECEWLDHTGRFDKDFVDYLSKLRFSGEVHALPEGSVFFANEPVIRITASLPEAQIIETRLINLLQFQTLIASKAVRSVLAAPGKLLVDFGLRRAHGAEAGLLAARACYIAGFSGTSNVLAAKVFDIPIYGTMAHSYIMAHDDEIVAFEHFANAQPDNLILLIDTYNTEIAAHKVVRLADRLNHRGIEVKGVRLDSGDLVQQARTVRAILDDGGLKETQVFASGDLDEYELLRIVSSGTPINGFGVGTRIITSEDAPFLNCAYKLQEYAGQPRRKLSEGKTTWPGKKQIYRNYDQKGIMQQDLLTLESDKPGGFPLIQQVMENGHCLNQPEPLSTLRDRTALQLSQLPEALLSLEKTVCYPVNISDQLRQLAADIAVKIR